MILLAFLALAFLASLLGGGRIERLAHAQIKFWYLILLALGIQILIFSVWWQGRMGRAAWSGILYGLSMLLLVVACWANHRVPGIGLLGIGLVSNAAMILLNGGHMPASLQALQSAGIVDSRADFEAARVTNSSLMDTHTLLWFLGDIFAVPRQVPLANVFSIGDVLIALGAGWFVWAHMRATPPHELPDDQR
jgi:hypothetical protein